ncbi:helix-turn-helix transcriptional regulator [Falsiroseomonas sp. HW251]|uniref:helix-turn-helix transcriptional regulator n=1 Tax=Falsiroseomonas sp. HW251 TaxID=3390998 RepID=UPI003D310321
MGRLVLAGPLRGAWQVRRPFAASARLKRLAAGSLAAAGEFRYDMTPRHDDFMVRPLLMPGRLRDLRKAASENQVDLAAVIGRSRAYVAKLEGGAVNPSIEMLIAIARHYKTTPNDLLGWDGTGSGRLVAERRDQRAILALFERLPREDRDAIEQLLHRLAGARARDADDAH